MSVSVAEAYRVCREIARREAKNFYYAFLALPEAKRNAICAVYAFMRHADDLSDDESMPRDKRRNALATWQAEWHSVELGASSDDPVFTALADAQRRFQISSDLLDQLVEGTAMDLNPVLDDLKAEDFNTYESFEDLYRYCYYVASVVGLVCIRIFGYSDARAEKLAEQTGVGFQLTNILRDVREDAERGRIYLPQEDMRRFSVKAENLTQLGSSPALRDLLATQAERAERYYESGRALLPLIAADSRPALWVLIAIYHRLLRRIEQRNYNVLRERIVVPAWQKLAILARGLLQVLWNRLWGKR